MVEDIVVEGEAEESEEEVEGEESEEESDLPDDDFGSGDEGEEAVVIGEEGSDDEDDSDEEEEDLDDTLKEEDWKRPAKAKPTTTSSGEEEEDEGDDEASEDEEEGEDVDEEGNVGWADAMKKVLAMGKRSEQHVGVLSKAKKDNAKPKDGEGKVLEPLALRKARKRELDSIGRSMPDPLRRNAERSLARIATRGVVQLFNAVREQQKDMKTQLKQAGGSFRRQENVLKTINKSNFINMLSGKAQVDTVEPPEKRSKMAEEEEEEEEEGEEEGEGQRSSWNILRDDFMLGAKMKDWDKESDGE